MKHTLVNLLQVAVPQILEFKAKDFEAKLSGCLDSGFAFVNSGCWISAQVCKISVRAASAICTA